MSKKDLVSGLASGVIRGVIASRTGQPADTTDGEATTPRRSLWQSKAFRRVVIGFAALVTLPLWAGTVLWIAVTPGALIAAVIAGVYLLARRSRGVSLGAWLAEQVAVVQEHRKATLIGAGVGLVLSATYAVMGQAYSAGTWIAVVLTLVNAVIAGAWVGALIGRYRTESSR